VTLALKMKAKCWRWKQNPPFTKHSTSRNINIICYAKNWSMLESRRSISDRE